MKQGRETTQEERIKIAKECIARGKNYGEMALKYQVSYQQAGMTQSMSRVGKCIDNGSMEGFWGILKRGGTVMKIKLCKLLFRIFDRKRLTTAS